MPHFRISMTCIKLDGTILHIPYVPVKDSDLYTMEGINQTVFAFVKQECYTLQGLTIDVIDNTHLVSDARTLAELLPTTRQWPQYQVFLRINNGKPTERFMSLYELETRLNNLQLRDLVSVRFGLLRQNDLRVIKPISEQDKINIDELLKRLQLPATVFTEWK